ncbi:MAG TPA: YbhB/YbcL family Raf kinase inhibitor-like protein [Planctomycetota bacterium]|nr:YbhB/YbcL family Raf kinase inhibitor-like protein [Planctomycetota bacterium]
MKINPEKPPSEVREPAARGGGRAVEILDVTSSAFGNGQRMPSEHARDGANRSPSLSWTRVPRGTRAFALLCEDPDAPGEEPFVHWLIANIPAAIDERPLTSLPEGISKEGRPPALPGSVQGANDFGEIGYDGPAPPRGHGTHHYHFRLYALDAPLELGPGFRKPQLLRALEGHVLGTGALIGTYSR